MKTMRKLFEMVNIGGILHAFHESVKGRKQFYILPCIVGVLMPFILKGGNEKAAATFNSFLTSFVPLFATILTFYISWCYNKIKTRHNKERLELFKATSTNILMMIPLDALALLLYVLSLNQWFQDMIFNEQPMLLGITLPAVLANITWHDVFRYILLSAYYSIIFEIMLILLMVCKRAHVIINNEIALLTTEDSEKGES